MSAPNDGGPAFPLDPLIGKSHFDDPMAYPGMTLRDWFAGMALKGYLSSGGEYGEQAIQNPDTAARWAYDQSDAMIAERAKPNASKTS